MALVKQLFNIKVLLLSFAIACCLSSASYVLTLYLPQSYRAYVAWPLFPGVAAYSIINGSLLFGNGFGKLGNMAVIVLCSATIWAFVVYYLLVRQWFKR